MILQWVNEFDTGRGVKIRYIIHVLVNDPVTDPFWSISALNSCDPLVSERHEYQIVLVMYSPTHITLFVLK